MTDILTGKKDAERVLAYLESIAKESRKALTIEFNEKRKGIPFNTAPQILRDSLLTWFRRRDNNVRLIPETTNSARPGEVHSVFAGETNKVQFKVHVDAMFTMTGSAESPCYLKGLNVSIDRNP